LAIAAERGAGGGLGRLAASGDAGVDGAGAHAKAATHQIAMIAGADRGLTGR
jgi:hypothetical protein